MSARGDNQIAPVRTGRLPLISPSLQRAREIIVGVWHKTFEDEVFGRAAQLAYYWLFSLFPLLVILTALLAYLPIPLLADSLFSYAKQMLPREAHALVLNTLKDITLIQRGNLIQISFLILVWSSSSGMEAIIGALNKAYNAPPTRAYWQEKLLAIALTLALMVFVIVALALLFFGESIGEYIAHIAGYDTTFTSLWNLAQWPVIIGFMLLALDAIYYLAPNIAQRWRVLTPGALFALVSWLLVSFGFRHYVARFGRYSATYGALGGVMILMLWFYLTGVAILLGGVINSVIQKQNGERERPAPPPTA